MSSIPENASTTMANSIFMSHIMRPFIKYFEINVRKVGTDIKAHPLAQHILANTT